MKKTFSEIIDEYHGQPFKAAGNGNGGFGCIDLCHHIITKGLGKEMPSGMDELTIENYAEVLKGDLTLERERLAEIIKKIGIEIDINRILPGDLLLIRTSKGGVLSAIYIGKGQAITSSAGIGVCVLDIDDNNWIETARRFD